MRNSRSINFIKFYVTASFQKIFKLKLTDLRKSTNMEADLRLMEKLKEQIEKGRNNFKKSPKERVTKSFVVARLEGLEKIADRFRMKHEDIIYIICLHCNEHHKLFYCGKFAKEDLNVRQNIVNSLGLCYNCLGSNHTRKMCRVLTTCGICKRKHHTLLHGKASSYTVAVAREATETDEVDEIHPESSFETNETTNNIVNNFVTDQTHNQSLLATALIKVQYKDGNNQILRALLDQRSQASFISEAAVQLLRLDKINARSSISGLGGGRRGLVSKYVVRVNMLSLSEPSFKMQVDAHVLNKVTSVLPERKFSLLYWEDLRRITLADPQYNSPHRIDILLVTEVYCKILKKGLIKHPSGCTIAQDIHLGWVLSGQVSSNNTEIGCHNKILNMHANVDEDNELLKRIWMLESEPNLEHRKILNPEEQQCEEHFAATTIRDQYGRYIVELPSRPNFGIKDRYGDTRKISVKRLLSLEKRLSKCPEQEKDYAEALKEYVMFGHMEEVGMDLLTVVKRKNNDD
ncbi:unnamed protein product [Parnassius mnemosyne]|uniref:Peptidase aspartic putative domain-containing protein n=1 Tax=Parnassius mnemosyne TaxID=213953 RepID=A0AAV1L4E3_9NEOP